MVTALEYPHVPTGTLAVLAQRLGRVLASPSTWYHLARAEFCEEFTREMNRLRMEHRASLSSAERELERVRAGIRKIIDAIKDGFAGPELKAEMDELQARKESLGRAVLKGNLAAMISAAQYAKRSPEATSHCK